MEWVTMVALIAASGVIALLLHRNSEEARMRRALRGTPRQDIAEVVEGTAVKIIGELALDGDGLRAPLTGRLCAYYEVVVERKESSGGSTDWRVLIHESDGEPFWLEDDTGRALIEPADAKILLIADSHTRSGTFDDATEREEAYLARHGHGSKGWVFNKKLRYREGVLEPGEDVAVLGRAVREPDPDQVDADRAYRDGPATRLRFTSSRQEPTLISDTLDALRER